MVPVPLMPAYMWWLQQASLNVNYSCTFTSHPAYTGKNTATATWDKATALRRPIRPAARKPSL